MWHDVWVHKAHFWLIWQKLVFMLFVLGLKSEESVKLRAGVRNHRPAEIQVCSYANNTVQTLGVGRIVSCLCSLRQPNIYCNLNESVVFVFMWSKLYFQHHYSSLQCHMIFRNHANMLLKKPFWLLSMLRTVVLLPVFVETVIHFFFQNALMNRKIKRTAFLWNINLLQHCLYRHFWSI